MSTALEKRWFKAVAELETCVLCGAHGVQVSHSNMERGMGQKSAPWYCAALCPECHEAIDNGRDMTKAERRYNHFRAVVLTHARLIHAGKLGLL